MHDGVFRNSPADIVFYAEQLKTRKVKPTLTVFDLPTSIPSKR